MRRSGEPRKRTGLGGATCLVALGLAFGCAAPRQSASKSGPLEGHPEPDLVTTRHTVAAGETLYGIARGHGVTVRELAAANGLSEERPLSIGEELLIPGGGEAAPKVEAPRGAEEKGADPRAAPERERSPPERSPKEKGPPPRQVGTGVGTLQWPLRGVLYARFGRKGKEPHDGIDLAAPAGTPVKTAAPGEVLFAGEQKGYGLLVIVEHPNGLITLYAHNRDLRVKAGQKVREGQVVATVGESGRTSGPHLHFEVREKGAPVDPVEHLGPLPPK